MSESVEPTRTRKIVRKATRRMSSRVEDDDLILLIEGKPVKKWRLPDKSDTEKLRLLRAEAVQFAAAQGATEGQQAAMRRTMWKEGYGSGRRRGGSTGTQR